MFLIRIGKNHPNIGICVLCPLSSPTEIKCKGWSGNIAGWTITLHMAYPGSILALHMIP